MPIKKGEHISPKTEFKKGLHPSPKTEFKKGQVSWLKGKKGYNNGGGFQKGHKGYKYWLGKKMSEETKMKLSKANMGRPSKRKGIPLSEETKKKISMANKGKPSPNYWLGKHHTEEYKQKMSKIKKESGQKPPHMAGENHYNWQGGISFAPYPISWTDDLKETIRKRDGYICQLCGVHQDEYGLNYKLDCHHIDYNKDNLNPENLISLCRNCHIKTNYNRDYWINYFKTSC